MTPEAYNAIRGHAFSIMVMDLVRKWHKAGDERITMWSLSNHIAEQYTMDKHDRQQLYYRIKGCIRGLVNSGYLTSRMEYIAEKNVTVKILTPCSETSER